ncbi:hypothetical protein EYF80_067483 [Liparis tanakae]|uniref:Uncharacterized protein n=1 Tax=Liparis tanakae TaxID=230148 RepID=A0A4Z2E0V6_9TELE|nr:hypothetical protein EYF80_067483 [Liparis tanakae]
MVLPRSSMLQVRLQSELVLPGRLKFTCLGPSALTQGGKADGLHLQAITPGPSP